MKTRSTTLAAALSVAMVSFAAAPAAAADTQKGRAAVSYSDLDLDSEAGRAELGKRFEQAAREMCGVNGTEAPRGRERYCYETTSKSLEQRAAAILAEHDGKDG